MGKGVIRQLIIRSSVLLFLLAAAPGLQAHTFAAYPLRYASGNLVNCSDADDYDLLVDGSGNLHLLWSESGYFYYGRIVHSAASGDYYISSKEYTNVNIYLDGVSTWFTQPRAAVRRDGQTVHFVWGYTLKHAWRNSSGVWSKETVRTISGVQKCRAPSVVVEDNETVHILYGYYDGSNGDDPHHLFYQRKPAGGSWSGFMEIDVAGYYQGAEWRNPVMTLDHQGGIHATWSNQIYWATDDGGAARYRYAPAGSGLETAATVIVPRPYGVAMDGVGNVFVDPFGKVHRTICTSLGTVDYTSMPSGASGAWSAPTRPSMGVMQAPEDTWSSVTTDSCGRVLVAFPDGTSQSNYPYLYVSVLDAGVWTKYTISTTAGLDFFRQPSLVSAGGALFLLWRESSGQLYLATAPDSCGSLTVISPNGGEVWTVGGSRDITWNSTGVVGLVNIDYSTDSGATWASIVSSTANDGLHPWTVPNPPSATCLLRLREVDGSPADTSNAAFTITADETLSAPTAPSGPTAGTKATSYSYSTGGAISSHGHSVQYRFDWDDGTDSGWLAVGVTTASHSWSMAGTYYVRAMARCVAHTTFESLWSEAHAMVISESRQLSCDFNGDGQMDIAVWRPSDGYWYIRGQGAYHWGMNGDVPVPADYNADGKAELAVFRPGDGTWYVYYPGTGAYNAWRWGQAGDIPVVADFDHDGYADLAVFRPQEGMWYIRKSSDWGMMSCKWGTGGDIPVPRDYDQDGYADLAVYRPREGTWYIRKSSDWGMISIKWGTGDDIPVPNDYDGDGKTDITVWRPGNGYWYIKDQGDYQWGMLGDVPLSGDHNGDRRADLVIWRPGNGFWYIKDQGDYQWGMNGDIPLD